MNAALMVRSHFSLMWGTASVRALCRAARARGYERLALTDTDNLYGLWPFLRACQEEGITPLVGAELTDPGTGGRATCLVRDDQGFGNLCRLLSQRHLDRAFSLQAAVTRRHQGLVVLTSAPGLLQAWHDRGVDVAAALPRRHGCAPERLRRLARRLGRPAAAVPASFFLDRSDHALHKVLRAIERRTSLSRITPRDAAPADAWLAPPQEYERRFDADPGALRAARCIADRCTFTRPAQDVVLPPWRDAQGRSPARVLREEAYAGARRRYGDDLSEAAVGRLEHELRQIEAMGFSAYFLVVRQIVGQSPRICGRGSGAASLVAYSLGITNVCPLKYNLYFERFLNPGRDDPPDIDVDFAWDERDEVLAWVLKQHRGYAAMVCNHVLFQPRMAIRETARVFGLSEREISGVVRHLPLFWREERRSPDLRKGMEAPPAVLELDLSEPWPTILGLAQKLIGTPRHLSVHPGGVVITPRPIDGYAPLQHAAKVLSGPGNETFPVPIVQWEKDGTEDSGLVKIDLLGNRSLGVIRDALQNARDNGRPVDEARWEPEDDAATQRAVAQGRTMGCFYIESPAMRLLQQKTGKGDFEHLVIHSSIIRPAANAFIREYIRRLKGGAWEPIHPLLDDVLEETFGIMVYQEDVSRAAVALAGFSHAAADGLRKILSKKDRERRLRDYFQKFAAGARRRGVSDQQIEAVWAMMMSFDGYSFCKPHSASYARVSFQAAFLKVHYPAEFIAAVISNGGGFYSAFAYVSEARRLGLTIQPPDVNHSQRRWRGRDRSIRVGLMSIKSLGQRTQDRVLAQQRQGPFCSLDDFLSRVRPDEEEARALIHAGACDGLAPDHSRAVLLWRLLGWVRGRQDRGRGRRAGPASGDLFAHAAAQSAPAPPLPAGTELSRLRRQFAVLGFLCDRHPMVLFAAALRGLGVIKARDLPQHVGRQVRVAGWLIAGKLVPTKHGEPMEFLTFEDETATVETTFFPPAYRRFCHILDYSHPYLLQGKVEQDFGAVTLTVDRVRALTKGGD